MSTQPQRLLSLDVFRGLTIALMILVNNPGSWSHVYPPLLHADWHGLTPTDLVFPFFMFIIGVSLYLSSSKFHHQLSGAVALKVIKRGLTIFLIGLALNWFPFYYKGFADLRLLGVLQRIGLAYMIGAFVCLSIDIRKLWQPALAILLGYWLALFIGSPSDPYSLENNFVRFLDLQILGEAHLWMGRGIPFDPEGLLSTIPAAVSIIIGYQIGAIIKTSTDQHRLVKNMLLIGVICIFIGLAWGTLFPVNKALWTSSYVLYTGGIACVVLGVLIELIDNRGYVKWTKPFQVFGLNPLIIYIFSGLLVKSMLIIMKWTNAAGETVNAYGWLWSDVFSQLAPNHLKFTSFLMALSHLVVCYLLGYILYRKKIVIKV
jgi:predicted acyltransferase